MDFGSRHDSERPDAAQEAAELFMEHGCVLLKRVFGQDYIAQLHRAFVDTCYPYFEDREFPDALNVGAKRTQVTRLARGLIPRLFPVRSAKAHTYLRLRGAFRVPRQRAIRG
jgi:hypothetical protein